jgi:glycosyltransferase involved in cell wall biosynthesis
MKICFVGLENLPVLAREYNQHGIGGEQVQHTLLARALSRRGHTVSMVVGDYGQADGAVWDGVTTYKAYRFDAGLPVLRFIHPRWTGLWSAMQRANADIYYVSCAEMQVGQTAMFARIHGKQAIFRVASDMDCEPEHLLIRYWRDKKLYEYGLRRVGAIFAQGKRQRASMQRNYGLDSRVVTMLVEPAKWQLNFSERTIPVLWVSNLRQLKRPDLMVELAEGMPDLEMHMIGGPQPDFAELYETIRRQTEQLPNLKFHGRVPYHDVNESYERARVFVNTSDTEGFPNSYLQAWVRGTPVVSFFDPDGLIASEGLGRAVKSLDEMAIAVRELTSDHAKWQQASERCLAYMTREYGEDKILAPYLEEFSRLSAIVNSNG